MATIVLSVAGGIVGGPIGSAIGALIGNVIDQEVLFKPGARDGARLSDLRVQTSRYGAAVPRLFGTMRVAGCVLWATDLVEHRDRQGGGKGQPATNAYSYTASLAVALSARPILGVGRIWADGQLLRGAAGDFKVRTGFRLHLGGEDQPVDPLIAASEGVARTPAHRGIAYAVFEDLALASFGNRIPQLTFEVFADAGPVTVGAVAAAVGGVAAEALATPLLGFCAQEATVRATLDTLCTAGGGWLRSDGAALALVAGSGTAARCDDLGMQAGRAAGGRAVRSRAPLDTVPARMSVGYYDPARDFQAGAQQATRPGPGGRETRIELPAAIDADGAKAIAADALARAARGRERRTVTLGWEALRLCPGDRITIAGASGQWRIDRWTLDRMVVKLDCVAIGDAPAAGAASAGRSIAAPDRRCGTTVALPFELPPIDDALAAAPRIVVAAAGTGSGWRRAALLCSSDAGASWASAGETAYPAVLGTVRVPPGIGCAALVDRASVAEVVLANPDMVLAHADAAALDAGANLAMLGDELLQFGRAEPLGDGRWRLSQLWRGRRGTDPAIGTQQPGDRFVLVTRDTLRQLEPSPAIGTTVRLLAQGVDDPVEGVPSAVLVGGISVLPPAPVQLRAVRRGSDTDLRWVRRSRVGWAWRDAVDVPLGEESERYQLEIDDGVAVRMMLLDAPHCTLSAADRARPLDLRVRQIGTHGLSPAAALFLPPIGVQP